jgi:ferredoxin
MLVSTAINHLLQEAKEGPTFRRSSCYRSRFRKNDCRKCVDVCGNQALRFDDKKIIHDINRCSGCMSCLSVCPADAFEWEGDWQWNLLKSIAKSAKPIIGCSRNTGEERSLTIPCLGIFPEAFLLAAAFSTEEQITLDLSNCDKCVNRHIVPALERSINSIEKSLSISLSRKIRLVSDPAEIMNKGLEMGRRKFFGDFKQRVQFRSKLTVDNFTDNSEVTHRGQHQKEPSIENQLLCYALKLSDCHNREGILGSYFYSMTVNEHCKTCGGCAGMCPTGAIKLKRDKTAKHLLFNVLDCNGCGLCRDFCRQQAISLNLGADLKTPLITKLSVKSVEPTLLVN